MWQKMIWSLRIRRLEYRIAELPIFLIPVCLAAPRLDVFAGLAFWESLFVFLLLFVFGDLLNCISDRDLDSVYKPHLSEAIDGLGLGNVWGQAIASGVLAVLLSVHLAIQQDRWLLPPMVLFGLALAYAYSIEPFRLKRRGFWQLMFYWLGLFAAPMLMPTYLFSPQVTLGDISVAIAYGLMQTGVILVNTAEDFPEDRSMRVRTIVVATGLENGVRLSWFLTTLGGVFLGSLFVYTMRSEGWTEKAWFGIIPFGLALSFAVTQITRLHYQVRGQSEATAMVAIRKSAKLVPLRITSLALSSLVASVIILWQRVSH